MVLEQPVELVEKLVGAEAVNVLIDALRTNPNLALVQNWRSLATEATTMQEASPAAAGTKRG